MPCVECVRCVQYDLGLYAKSKREMMLCAKALCECCGELIVFVNRVCEYDVNEGCARR